MWCAMSAAADLWQRGAASVQGAYEVDGHQARCAIDWRFARRCGGRDAQEAHARLQLWQRFDG